MGLVVALKGICLPYQLPHRAEGHSAGLQVLCADRGKALDVLGWRGSVVALTAVWLRSCGLATSLAKEELAHNRASEDTYCPAALTYTSIAPVAMQLAGHLRLHMLQLGSGPWPSCSCFAVAAMLLLTFGNTCDPTSPAGTVQCMDWAVNMSVSSGSVLTRVSAEPGWWLSPCIALTPIGYIMVLPWQLCMS